MKQIIIIAVLSLSFLKPILAQNNDTIIQDSIHLIQELLVKQQMQSKMDSLVKAELQQQLLLATNNSLEKNKLEEKLKEITKKDSLNKVQQNNKLEALKKTAKAYYVTLFKDTLFPVFTKIGSFTAKARSEAITKRINSLYADDLFIKDSLKLNESETSIEIVYKSENIIMSINDIDALWFGKTKKIIAANYLETIKTSIEKYKEQNSTKNTLMRLGQLALIIFCLGIIVWLINKLFAKTLSYIKSNQDKYLNGIKIKSFQLFSANKHREFAFRLNNWLRVFVILLVIYLSLPLMFSIFPETKTYTDTLLSWVISPAKRIVNGIIGFLPNLITIIVIYYITKWAIKGIHYFFSEVEKGNIVMGTFHKDWAIPTFNILKFILYAFMLVVIFPYLPGSESAAFQGVSVFLGVLLSLGSSSAITNVIAGLVITYMRPFKIGDRVKIGDVVGDVLEKTMLVTRIRTIKNEDITVPNSTVLSSHTINYSSNAEDKGLIIHSTVTIGYDVPWKKMHQALIDAALRTNLILKEPLPFVLQTSLDDFYVSYQINAYTKEPNKQAIIYSELHQHIQDCCNEVGIEILSPHYRAARDGNMITIPENYLAKDYKAPSFNVNVNNSNK